MGRFERIWKEVPVTIGQCLDELKVLSLLLEELQPGTVLEIGSLYGGTLWWWIQICPEDTKFISVEPVPKGSNWESWLRGNQQLFVIRGKSQERETIERVKGILNGENLDFLFIDGYHWMPAPKLDYENYSPLVKRGIIALHDTEHPKDEHAKMWEELTDYWGELKEQVKLEEGMLALSIVSSYSSAAYGTGVILKRWGFNGD